VLFDRVRPYIPEADNTCGLGHMGRTMWEPTTTGFTSHLSCLDVPSLTGCVMPGTMDRRCGSSTARCGPHASTTHWLHVILGRADFSMLWTGPLNMTQMARYIAVP
jgi:hypothetical protein